MVKTINIFIAFILICLGCSEEDHHQLMKPQINTTDEKLLSQGFEKIQGVDLNILSKSYQDKLIQFEFESGNSKPSAQAWKFKVPSLDESRIRHLMRSNRCHIISPIEDRNKFFVKHIDFNIILECLKLSEENKSIRCTYLIPR